MSEVREPITRSKYLDWVLIAAVAIVLGFSVIHDNHHLTKRDVGVFLVSSGFWVVSVWSILSLLGVL